MNNWLLKKVATQTIGIVLCFVMLFVQAIPAFAEDIISEPAAETVVVDSQAETQTETVIDPVSETPKEEAQETENTEPEVASEPVAVTNEVPAVESTSEAESQVGSTNSTSTDAVISTSENTTETPIKPITPCVIPVIAEPQVSPEIADPNAPLAPSSTEPSEQETTQAETSSSDEGLAEVIENTATETDTLPVTTEPETSSEETVPSTEALPVVETTDVTPQPVVCPSLTNIDDGGILAEDGSIIDATTIVDSKVQIINTNDVKVINEAKSDSISGDNAIISGDSGQDATLESGDVNVFANVLTVVNTNSVNSEIANIVENFNNLSSDLILNNPTATPSELTQDLVSQVCTEIACKSLNSFSLSNKNVAEVENNIDLLGHSGRNRLENVEERGSIRSGNVNALVNILNIVNTNLYNSRWTIATINIFGDWTGDLVLPSELYFNGSMQIGATDESSVNVEEIKKVIFDVSNTNDVGIENNINVETDSGQNSIIATGTPDGKKGDIENTGLETGDSQGLSNVKNFVNTNIVNSRWYIGMINTLGNWSGNVFSLPDQVAMTPTPTGLAFFSTTANRDQAFEIFDNATANFENIQEETVSITNDNDAVIRNNVDLGAFSGENGILSAEVEDSNIRTGHTFGLANVLNFANTNLINANLHLGMINIFGNWQGNIHFGFPDLEVTSLRAPEQISGQKDQPVNYELGYKNEGDSSVTGASVDFHYDADRLAYVGNDRSVKATQFEPGVVTFELGRVAPNQENTLNIQMRTVQNILEPGSITTFARIDALVPERNEDNNEKRVSSPLVPIAPGSSSGNTTGGNNNGSSNSSGSGTSGTDTSTSGSASNDTQGTSTETGGQTGSSNTDNSSSGSSSNTSENNQVPSGNNTNTSNQSGGSGGSNINYSSADYSTPSPRGLIRVFSTNTAAGRVARVGDTVEFQVKISNDGIDDLYNVVVNDVLRGPDGKVITNRAFPLGKLASNELVEISYELEVTTNALAGVYSGTVFATGINGQLQAIQSEASSISYFTVERQSGDTTLLSASSSSSTSSSSSESASVDTQNTDASSESTNSSESAKPNTQKESTDKNISIQGVELSQARLVNPVVLSATDTSSSNNQAIKLSLSEPTITKNGKVTLNTSSQKSGLGTPSIFEGVATTADAKIVRDITIPEWATFLGDGREATPSSTAQMVNIIAIAFLIAVGYALASVKEKFKKAKRAF